MRRPLKTVRHFNRAVAALFALCAVSGVANAATNLALMADGASFVAASSQDPAAKGAALTTMQDNLLTNKPTAWLQNGDKRYIFGPGDTNQWIEISLGRIDEVSLIGAKVSLPYSDRWVVGPLMVEVSTNGTSWTEFGQPLVLSKTSKNPIEISASPEPVKYIKYFFGPSDPEYKYGGSSLKELYAYGAAVPEPATWTALVVGFGFVGAALRSRRNRVPVGA